MEIKMRKKPAEPVNHERWLVSYADLVTLLFALFVVLYATSQADVEKLKKVSESFKQSMGGGKAGDSQTDKTDKSNSKASGSKTGAEAGAGDLNDLSTELSRAFESAVVPHANEAETLPVVEVVSQGLLVRLTVPGFYERNQIDVSSDLRPLINRIGKVLARTERKVVIEGHSDTTEGSERGLELSALRANWLGKYWIKTFALDPSRISIAGYSFFKTLPEELRKFPEAERRVEFMILR